MEKKQNNKPGFNLSWLYMIIIFGLGILLYTDGFGRSGYEKEVSYTEFQSYVATGKGDKVVLDKGSGIARLTIKPEHVRDVFKKSAEEVGKDPAATTRIGNPASFEDFVSKYPVQVTYEEKVNYFSYFLSFIVPVLLLVGLWYFMFRRAGGGGASGGIFSVGKSKARLFEKGQGTNILFKDVAGQEGAKQEVKEIVDFLKNPAKYTELGGKIPKGALLVGPPGTGKTLLAKAVAGEAKVPFFSISGSEFVEMFVGMGAARVRDLFKQAQEKAPCIVFIDEIDAIGKRRDSGQFGGNDEREQTLNQLLSEMDGFDGSKGVVILAATNRPESLDKALLRPGRFDRRIPVELPDIQGREAILKVHARDVKMADNVDFKALARATAGASGAELANIVNEGALRAVKLQRQVVEQADLEESIEVVIAGYQRKGAVISPEEKKVIAYHEIGHALVAAMQKNSAPVHKITIIPRTNGALGYTMQIDENDSVLMKKETLFNKIVTITGGRSAEELVFGSITSGAANDIEQATRIARSMVTRLGMTEEFDMMATEVVTNQYLGGDTSLACSQETAGRIDAKVLSIIKEAHDKARQILSENREKLDVLANFLLEKETITGEEFMALLRQEEKSEATEA